MNWSFLTDQKQEDEHAFCSLSRPEPLYSHTFVSMHKLISAIIFGLLISSGIIAQDTIPDTPVIQLSGLVVTGDSLTPVPLSTVYRERDMRGTITDVVGFFSLPAFAGDTIVFSNIGYLDSKYIIPDSLGENRLSIVQFMRGDTVLIDVAEVLPYPHPSRFKDEFLALDIADNEYIISRQNLDKIVLYDRMMDIHSDGAENYRHAMQQHYDKMYYNGQANPISLLNPIAWAQFFQAWRNGDFKR